MTLKPQDPVLLAWGQPWAPIPVDTLTPFPVTVVSGKVSANNGGLTDRSGTVTAGGTAQQLMAANANRNGWSLYNSSTGNLWINDVGGTALIGGSSFLVAPNFLYESPPNGSSLGAISIYGATTGQTFAAREY